MARRGRLMEVDVAHHAGAAAHGGHLGLGMAGLVVLEVEGRVQEDVVREQALGADLHAQLEQVVVGVALVVVDPLLDLEDVDGEDGRFAVAQARVLRQQDVADGHAALGGGVGAVVNAAEGGLGAGAGVHGVQVVHKAFHGLVGVPVGLLVGTAAGGGHNAFRLFGGKGAGLGQGVGHDGVKLLGLHFHAGLHVQRVGSLVHRGGGQGALVLTVQQVLHAFGQLFQIELREALADPLGHAVVEVGDGLAAVLVVLVGLDGDGRQRRVAANAGGLAQKTVAGGEAAVEQAQDVDLGAGGGEGIEIEIVDVDVALGVSLGLLGSEQVGRVVGLGAGGADLQHAAHGGVAVDVGVVTLHVADTGVHVGDLVDGLHQAGVGLADTGAVGPVQDVLLGRLVVAALHQAGLHRVLDLLDLGGFLAAVYLQVARDLVGHAGRFPRVALAGGLQGLEHGGRDLALVEQNYAAIPLDNAFDHDANSS